MCPRSGNQFYVVTKRIVPDIRYPAEYPVSFAGYLAGWITGYPARKTMKLKTVMTNKIISICNRDIHYNSVLFHGQDIYYIYIYIT